jgi:hypothetical protein
VCPIGDRAHGQEVVAKPWASLEVLVVAEQQPHWRAHMRERGGGHTKERDMWVAQVGCRQWVAVGFEVWVQGRT